MKKLSDMKVAKSKKSKGLSRVKKAVDAKSPAAKSKRTQLILIIIASVLLVATVAVFVFLLITSNKKSELDQLGTGKEPENVKYFSPLTGRETTKEKTTAPVFAVMIENSPDARPQSGLKDAGVIFEAVAEGGITRFIILYQEAEPQLIGPVRSARAYYLEWAAAFDPAVAHVGGSGDALQMIRSGNYGVDLDQFYNAGAYWRAKDRYAPHNVYTDFQHLNDLAKSKGKTSSQFTGWSRTDGKTSEAPNATAVSLEPSSGQFNVSYNYDASTNTYHRMQGGQPHTDREKGQITPDVVIAFRVTQTLRSDRLHYDFQTSGSGEAYIFQNGTATAATWQKADARSQIKFVDSAGAEVQLNRGQVWLTAVGQGRNISWQ